MTSPDHSGKRLAWKEEDLMSSAELPKVKAGREEGMNVFDLGFENG